jgi:uncharacterized repeat protein (TIGR01451 family)
VPAISALLVTALMLGPAVAFAKPDFSRSTITLDPATPKEGDVVTFAVHLRNSGDEPAPFTEVEFELPLEALFVDATGLDGAKVDPREKVIAAMLDLPPGADRQFSVRMVVPHNAGGRSLTPHLKMRYAHAGIEFYGGGDPVTIDTRVAQTGVALGGVRFNPASLALIGVLLLYPVLRALTGSRKGTQGPSLMIVVAVGFLSIFVAMALHDWRTISAFRQSSCTVLDSSLRVDTSPSAISSPGRRSQNTTYEPLLALRYAADGREVIGTGYSTGSRLSIGRGESTIREAAQFTIGAQVPCWFDPDDPTRVMVLPGFGGAYFFALLPLGMLVVGVWALAGTRRA